MFQSTPPVRGATSTACNAPGGTFQSTPPVRGATTNFVAAAFDLLVSIHAPRAGSDLGPSN
ncbi:Uncharacterized protein dnm_098610 [Desulfonema magnum]|uniref:Uncharacterized protein n=1 Tax=Desulfonema magnum TaxID=45655 RepID=A0A975BXQ4_9BACT|nr:Uncharacterized protein dnm_098610 [Desulfonema magnum]